MYMMFLIAIIMMKLQQLEVNEMNEYRCTRNQPYESPSCFGHDNKAERQGYYYTSPNKFSAIRMMSDKFFSDIGWAQKNGVEPFTCDLWKENVGTRDEVSHGI